MDNNKAWQLSKQLASLIALDEARNLQGEERERFNVMVAQDFYNLFNAYNERYVNKTWSEKLTKILKELESGLYEAQGERLAREGK